MLNKKIKFFIYITQFIILTTYISYVFIKSDETTIAEIKIVYNKSVVYLNLSSSKKAKQGRLFCFILTSSGNFLGGKAKIIYDSWASKCDNYKFVSVIPEEIKDDKLYKENGTEFNYGFDIMQPPGLGVSVHDSYDKVKIIIFMCKIFFIGL